MDCGTTNEDDENSFGTGPVGSMVSSPLDIKVRKAMRVARWILAAQAVFFCIIGLYGLFNPKGLVFNVVINEYYAHHFNENLDEYKEKLDHLSKLHDQELEENAKSSSIWKIAMMLVDAPDSTKADMKEALEGYEKAQEIERMKHPEEVALMAPTQLASSMMFAVGIYSALIRWARITEINRPLAHFFILWYSCIIVGMIAAVTHRGEGLSSSLFTIGFSMISMVFAVVWLMLRDRFPQLLKEDYIDELSTRSA